MDTDAGGERLVSMLETELPSTAEALAQVPRHEFVPEAYSQFAYSDRPLPIGEGQTISAPHMVAEMCDLLALSTGDRTLEIGTGCSYHAAVAAEIIGAETLHSVELSADLAESARRRLGEVGYDEVSIRVGDGREGWPEHAPSDKLYLTCAVRSVPDPLCDQLVDGGLLVAPIGVASQRLVLLKVREGKIVDRLDCGPVQFVPMQGPDGWRSGSSLRRRISPVGTDGRQVVFQQSRKIATAQISESERFGPGDDPRILGDDASVEFASENEQIEILSRIEHALPERAPIPVSEIRDDGVDFGFVWVIAGGLVVGGFGLPDGRFRDSQATVDPVAHLVDKAVDHVGGDRDRIPIGVFADDPGVELPACLLGDRAVVQHCRQLAVDRRRHMTGDVEFEARSGDQIKQSVYRLVERLSLAADLLGQKQRGVEYEPLFKCAVGHTPATHSGVL